MFLKFLILSVFSLSSYASGWSLKKNNEIYHLEKENIKLTIDYNGLPKFIKSYEDGPLEIIEYYAGEFGTSNIYKVYNRIVLLKKSNKVLIRKSYMYEGADKDEQPQWSFDLEKRKIKVIDPTGLDETIDY